MPVLGGAIIESGFHLYPTRCPTSGFPSTWCAVRFYGHLIRNPDERSADREV